MKADWSGVTAEEHKQSLIADAQDPVWLGPPPALERLACYYPDAAEEVAVSLLQRELYVNDVVWDFIENELVIHTEVEDWRSLIDGFRDKRGKNIADAIPYWFCHIYWKTSSERDEEFLREQSLASKIFMQLYPDYDAENPPVFGAAEPADQYRIARAVRYLESRRIDEAVHQLFLAGFRLFETRGLFFEPDATAVLSFARPHPPDVQRIYIAYFERRVSELKDELAENPDSQYARRNKRILAKFEDILASIED